MNRAVRQGLRWIARRPLVSLTSIGCLALGVAACAAAWTLIDAAILRPFDLRDADRIDVVWETDPARNHPLIEVSYLNFVDWQSRARTVESMATFGSQHWPALARVGGEVLSLATRGVSVTFFPTLGVSPSLGRNFEPRDAEPSQPPAIVLSHRLWRSRFGGDPAIVGRNLFVDGVDHVVIGIMPARFAFPDDPDAYVSVERVLGEAFQKMPLDQQRQVGVLEVLTKRRLEASTDDLLRELTGIVRDLQREHAGNAASATIAANVTPLADMVVGRLGRRLWIALGMSLGVLLLACANVAAARAAHLRERAVELGARLSLGATRGRLLRELACESLPLVALAGIAASAAWFLLIALVSTSSAIRTSGVALDEQRSAAVGAIVLLCVVAWVLVGLVPAAATARRVAAAASSGARVVLRTSRVGAPLLLAQAALAIAVVTVAGAAAQTFYRLSQLDLGFSTEDVVLVDFSLPGWKYSSPADVRRTRERLEAAAAELGGVRQVAAVSPRPYRFGEIAVGLPVRRTGDPLVQPEQATAASRVAVTPAYFEAIGQRVVDGRVFTSLDRQDTEPVVVLSRTLAQALFGDTSPVGQRIDTYSLSEKWRSRLVVGVVGDARSRGLERPSLEVYVPASQIAAPIDSLVIATGTPLTERSVREALRRIEPDLAIEGFRTSAELHASVLSPARLLASIVGLLGGTGLLLLTLGVFAGAAAALRAAWSEIAVRQAIGARPLQAARAPLQALSRALTLGIAAGLALAPMLVGAAEAVGLSVDGEMLLPLAGAALLVVVAAAGAVLPSLFGAARLSPAQLLRNAEPS